MPLTSPYNLDGSMPQLPPEQYSTAPAPAPVPLAPLQPLPAAQPLAALGNSFLPNYPTIPSGGIAPTPVAAPVTGGYNPPQQQQPINNILQSLNLPGINGQQFVAQAYGSNQTSPSTPTANWANQPLPGAASQPWNNVAAVATGAGGFVRDPGQAGQQVQSYLDDLLKSGNPYITNAARRGLEVAGSRGLLNSSIAAGSSTRAAIEASQPILNEIMGLNNAREGMQFQGGESAAQRSLQASLQAQDLNFKGDQEQKQRDLTASLQQQGWSFEAAQNEAQRQVAMTLDREGRAFQGEQAQLNRVQGVNDSLLDNELGLRSLQAQSFYGQQNSQQDFEFRRAMQSDSVAQQDWLTNQNFSREFNAGLAMLPIQNASQLHNAMMQAALDQPEVYTPEVLSGFSNFFNNQFLAQMQMYFPQTSGGTP